MITISIVTQKGGSSKTASSAALIAGLQREGLRVLAVDVDPQRNLSAQLGAGMGLYSVVDVLAGKCNASQALQTTPQAVILPADSRLAAKDTLTGKGDQYALKRALEPLQGHFDVCIVDTPPNVGPLTVAAMVASDGVIIPCVPDRHNIDALKQTAASIEAIKRTVNKGLRPLGVLPTMYQKRFTVHRVQLAQLEQIAAGLGFKVYGPIRYCPVVQEVEFMGQSVFDARKENPAAIDYGVFVKQVLSQIQTDRPKG